MVPRNTGETPTFKGWLHNQNIMLLELYSEENTVYNCSKLQIRFRAVVSNFPKVEEPKCKIEPNGASEEEIMFVRTS